MPPRSADRRAEALRNLLLVVVTDRKRCRGELVASCEAAVRGGATAILLRDKDLPRAKRRALARKLKSITVRYNATLLIHTDAALAREVDADGVHLDSKAGPAEIAAARMVVGRGRLIGISTHSTGELDRATHSHADYAFLGSVQPTASHPGGRFLGMMALKKTLRLAKLPIVPIGGMSAFLAGMAVSCDGSTRVAAVGAVLGVRDPSAGAGEFLFNLALGSVVQGVRGARGSLRGSERYFVTEILNRIGKPGVLLLGPGDDAAVLRTGETPLAVSMDLTVEGVHYRRGKTNRDAGYKAAARALSDLAAVGAEPMGLMVGLALRGLPSLKRVLAIESGARDAAAAANASILGGDTKETPGAETLAVTAFGRVAGPPALPRSGGRPGDILFVSGALGGSIHGRHLRPEPRIQVGLALRKRRLATACIDISDGLATDLHRLCLASKAGALLDASRIPIHRDARRRKGDPLHRALTDGEDYELLFSVPPDKADLVETSGVAGRRMFRIGRLVHRNAGLVVQQESGRISSLPDQGWFHFLER